MDFENKKTEQGIHYSRYIASWLNVGGISFGQRFAEWLKANGCTEAEIVDITALARCGKMELEVTAKEFVNKEVVVVN